MGVRGSGILLNDTDDVRGSDILSNDTGAGLRKNMVIRAYLYPRSVPTPVDRFEPPSNKKEPKTNARFEPHKASLPG